MKITIIVDNYTTKRNFIAEHGFAALIETGQQKILFDTGQGHALLHNLKIKNIDPKNIETIVLSHGHDDHTGGIKPFSKKNNQFEIFAHPAVLYPKYKITKELKKNIGLKTNLSEFNTKFYAGPVEISPKVIYSGEVPKINKWELEETIYYREINGKLEKDPFQDDVSLYIIADKGLVVLTGCAHSGIINIINYGMEITGINKLHGIIGGMHLKNASNKRIKKTVQLIAGMNPKFVTISHCTGILPGMEFVKKIGKRAIFTEVSSEFNF
ncbi:MAG: MBL fold metallo-hydrolase [Caldisericaceae bacterium]|nr:MBL fold metallo-hydrolase [Caldisericaceae bacterium]